MMNKSTFTEHFLNKFKGNVVELIFIICFGGALIALLTGLIGGVYLIEKYFNVWWAILYWILYVMTVSSLRDAFGEWIEDEETRR